MKGFLALLALTALWTIGVFGYIAATPDPPHGHGHYEGHRWITPNP